MTPNRAPTIVAVIPLYNGAPFIEEAIRSVLAQTRLPEDIVVIDDGSQDDGPAIVARMAERDPRIRLIAKPNGGQSSARNLGIAQTEGDLIALLDQDDAWYPDHLAELMVPFTEEAGRAAGASPLGWSYGNLDEVDVTGALINRSVLRLTRVPHPKTNLTDILRHDAFILPSATLISREAFEAVGGFDERLSGYEDDDLFLRLMEHGYGHAYVDKPLSRWRIYAASTSFSPRMSRSRMAFAEILIERYGSHHPGYVAEFVAPRFTETLLERYGVALRQKDMAAMGAITRDYGHLMRHLAGRRAVMARILHAVMPFPALTAPLWRAGSLARGVLRRLSGRR